MVLLPNMFKATSPATEAVPVGYFFNHSFISFQRRGSPGARFIGDPVQPFVKWVLLFVLWPK